MAPVLSKSTHTPSRGITVVVIGMIGMLPVVRAQPIHIASIKDLAAYALKSGNTVRMEPGVYRLIDELPLESMAERRQRRAFQFVLFSGSDNVFDLNGVTLEVDTALRAALRAPIHNPEFLITGDNNTLIGLTITNIGDGISNQGNVLSVHGHGNTLRNCTLHVRGSYPYGYGDLFGKGDPGGVIPHRKHSGLQISGSNHRIIGCRLYMRSYGHGFYIQRATNTYFEDCYVEGVMRSTDDMLAETSGPAFEAGFRSIYRNRAGEAKVTASYMKSLSEDGFRTYGDARGVTFINCTAKNMRAGFELRTSGPIRIENCAAIGNERGFWIGGDAVVRNSRGDAKYGPLLFLEGNQSIVELELRPDESDRTVHGLATIHGTGHRVTITPAAGQNRTRAVPILLGYSQPGAGEGMSPYGQRPARTISLRNDTTMPVSIGERAEACTITTRGSIAENAGRDNTIGVLPQADDQADRHGSIAGD